MKQPPDFVAQRESEKVCKLKKSVYELKQSQRAWFGQFAYVVRAFDIFRSQKDRFVFWREHQAKSLLFVVYVDDSSLVMMGRGLQI